MKGAGVRAALSESRGYSTAVNSFNSQYDYLPGDYKTAIGASGTTGGGGGQGDGNGIIEFVNSSSNNEGQVAWQHLVNSSMIDSTFTPTALFPTIAITPTNTVSSRIPGSKVKSAGWIFDKVSTGGTDSFLILTGSFASVAAASTLAVVTGVVSATDALAIDTKVDDGYPLTGRVMIPAALGAATPVSTTCFDNDVVVNSITKGSYYTAASGIPCAVGFQVNQ